MTRCARSGIGTVVAMLRTLPLIYLVVEFVVFYLVGRWIGFGWAFPVLLVTPFIGFLLARGAFRRLRRRTPSQRSTSRSTDTFTADIAVTVITGVLLVIPGIATFILGLLLLLPPVRSLVAARLGQSLGLRVMTFGERFTTGYGTRVPGSSGNAGEDAGTGGWGEVIDHRSGEFDQGDLDSGPDTGPGDGHDGKPADPGSAQ